MKQKKSRSIALAVGVVVLTIGVIFLLRKKPVSVEWQVLAGGEALETVLANGRVAGSRITPLALVKNGIVAEVPVERNSRVSEGDTLLLLDNRSERNRVKQRAADLTDAQINLKKLSGTDLRTAREELRQARILETTDTRRRERSDTLFAQGAITREDLDEAAKSQEVRASQRAIAEERLTKLQTVEKELRASQVERSRLLLEEARINLAHTVLRAPADGNVVDVLVEQGAFATAGAGLVLFLPADSVQFIEAMVDESDAGRIAAGQRALVATYNDPDTRYDAVVRGITGRIDADRGTATVRLGIRGDQTTLIADQTVSVQIITGNQTTARVVDQRFRFFSDDTTFVFVKQGGRAVRKQVTVTDIGNGRCILDSGVADGDTVLFAPGLSHTIPVTLQRTR